MKTLNLIVLWVALTCCHLGMTQSQTNYARPIYGSHKADLYQYFEPIISEFNISTFKRAIFRIGIDENGKVVGALPVNHALSSEHETELTAHMMKMEWTPMQKNGPVGCELYLIFKIDETGTFTIQTK